MTTPSRSWFERAMLIVAALFVIGVLTRYDLCFQHPEMLAHTAPHALRHGAGFGFHDFITAFNVAGMDGDSRPRVISYLASIITLKTRLLLWQWIPPHPSLSPMWLLTLVAGPFLFFKFLRHALDDRAAAFAGIAVYLVSVGCLSGAVMLFHPAKPLANVLAIAMLYLCARVHRVGTVGPPSVPSGARVEGRLWLGILALMAIAPFVDELAIFCAVVPLVWCPEYFWPRRRSAPQRRIYLRNWLLCLSPLLAVAVILFVVAPMLSDVVAPRHFDFADYLTRLAQPRRLSPRFLVWQANNLLMPGLLPWRWAQTMTPVADGPVLPLSILALLGIGGLMTLVVRAGQTCWSPYKKIALLMGLYVALVTAAFVFHELDLAATGFYYGATFSVLFATLVTISCAAVRSRFGAWPARAGLAGVLAMSMMNFFTLDVMWRAHADNMSIMLLQDLPIPRTTGDWRQLDGIRERRDEKTSRAGLRPTEEHYVTDQ
jgi:hypothetical protein